MMIKLNILDVERFLETVGACTGEVRMRCPDGGNVNINGREQAQSELREQHRHNGGCLPLILHIPEPSDYMRIVLYYVGDC